MLKKIGLFVSYLFIEKLLWLTPVLYITVFVYSLVAIIDYAPQLVLLQLGLMLCVVVTFLYYTYNLLVYLYRKKVLTYLKLNTITFSRKDLIVATLILIGYCGYCYLFRFPLIVRGLDFVREPFVENLYIYATLQFIFVFWEEVCARGFVLNKLKEKMSFQSANFMAAIIFTLQHYFIVGGDGYDVLLYTTYSFTLASLCIRFLLGYIAGIVMERSKSLWFSVVLHWMHNMVRVW